MLEMLSKLSQFSCLQTFFIVLFLVLHLLHFIFKNQPMEQPAPGKQDISNPRACSDKDGLLMEQPALGKPDICNFRACSNKDGLLTCSRCKFVKYCCRDCQIKDVSGHKGLCRNIAKLKGAVEEAAEPLRTAEENWFETRVGDFHLYYDTGRYMSSIVKLRDEVCLHAISIKTAGTAQLWEVCLKHCLEPMRLSSLKYDMCNQVPFLLLLIGSRDDDVVDYCCYWIRVNLEEAVDNINRNSFREGDWIFPRQEDSRFLDILEQFPKLGSGQVSGSCVFLFALWMVKMRLVSSLQAKILSSNNGPDDLQAVIEKQQRQADKLMERIMEFENLLGHGPFATIRAYPTPFHEKSLPQKVFRGTLDHPKEVWQSLCSVCLERSSFFEDWVKENISTKEILHNFVRDRRDEHLAANHLAQQKK